MGPRGQRASRLPRIAAAAYGGIDSGTLGRWLAGEASQGEQAKVETALDDLPELRQLADLLKDVLGGLAPVGLDAPPLPVAVPEPAPAVLPFKRPAPRRAGFFQKRAALAAAACLLLALGAGLPSLGFARPGDSAFVPAGGEASKALAGLDKMAAPDATMDAAQQRQAFREVSALTQAGQEANRRGDILQATDCFRQAQNICQNNGIPERHPAAANAIQGEARLIQLALNDAPASKRPLKAKKWSPDGHRTERSFFASVEEQAVGDVRRDMVPVLTEALRTAAKSDDRRAYASALGKVGPAAGPAVRTLVFSFARAHDPAEKTAALQALREMGPSARQEMLALLDERRHPHVRAMATPGNMDKVVAFGGAMPVRGGGPPRARSLNDDDKAKVREALALLSSHHANVGVQDGAGRCSLRAARDGTHALRKLAQSKRLEVLIETVAPGTEPDPAHRLAGLGERAVYVALCPAKKSVSLHVSAALQREKFPVGRMTKALDAAFAARGCDGAVAEVQAQMAALAK